MLQGRPLYDTPADHRYYVPPAAATVIRRAVERDNNTLLHGPRGSGKTTLLRQLQLRLRESGQPVVFVDGGALSEPLELALRVRDALKGRPGERADGVMAGGAVAGATSQMFGDPSPSPGGASALLYDTVTSLTEDVEPTVILVDASASAQAVYGIFGRMRDTVWQLPHRWLVAVDDNDYATALKPPADTFFDTVMALAPRSAGELLQILEQRTSELPVELLEQIAKEAQGSPRSAIRAANDALVGDHDPTSELSARARLIDGASRLGRPHSTLMAELLDLGQTSPSDKVMLGRIGLSRARVNTLLQQLAAAGLVESALERSDGPGRPRAIYRPVLRARA